MPAGERQLLSRFQAVSAREALVMMTAALVLGIAAGILSVGLNWSVHALREFSQNLGAGWLAILFPAIGAGLAVFMIRSMMKDSSGHGVSDVITAMTIGSERLPRRMIFSRFFGSLFTVGSGGSTGLEGPIVCVGGAVGAVSGRWLAMNERRRKLLIGYGVAGAVAGIFNAPLTGLIFTLEIIVGEWSILTILPTIISAVSATEISRILMGNKIAFYQDIAGFSFVSLIACVGPHAGNEGNKRESCNILIEGDFIAHQNTTDFSGRDRRNDGGQDGEDTPFTDNDFQSKNQTGQGRIKNSGDGSSNSIADEKFSSSFIHCQPASRNCSYCSTDADDGALQAC